MARFRIEGSDLDIEALEKQVDAAIEAKRGTRFTDAELERLAEKNHQYDVLDKVCGSLEELDSLPGAFMVHATVGDARASSAIIVDRRLGAPCAD